MDKRGQIYILIAIILAGVIFLLVSQSNVIREKLFVDRFEQISQNYVTEGNKLINSLLTEEATSGHKKFFDFTDEFVSYLEKQEPDVGVVYVLNYKKEVQIGNYLDTSIIINNKDVLSGCKEKVEASVGVGGISGRFDQPLSYIYGCNLTLSGINNIKITTADGIEYDFKIKEGEPQLQTVIREDEKNQTKVFYKK